VIGGGAGGLRRFLVDRYLRGSTELTYRLLGGRAGPRDFHRVVIVAALGRNNGIASGARLQWNALRRLGLDADVVDAAPALRKPWLRIPHRPGSAYIFHSGGPQTACLIRSVLPHAAFSYRVAYWAWELPDPPGGWIGCDRNVSEVWTPSAYAKSALSQIVSKPLEVVPHYISAFTPRSRNIAAPFTVLAMADSRSSFSRKNPPGALEAFRRAFGASNAARLRLKLSGSPDELRNLQNSFGDLSGRNVEIIEGSLSPTALTALYREADVLLSLHRAEGFGLPMLEAMAHGIPVVATGWSGNLEFMDPSNSRLVPYRFVPVADASAVYGGSIWAEPDLDAAANALRDLAADPDEYARLAAAAHRRISCTPFHFPFALPECASRELSEVSA
jgi:glycosyltransferase involved in cell wall biosynthesis